MWHLTSVDSDQPAQPPFKLKNSKCCSASSWTFIEYSSDLQRLWSACAYAQADLSICWSQIPHCWKSHVAAQIVFHIVADTDLRYNLILRQCTVTDLRYYLVLRQCTVLASGYRLLQMRWETHLLWIIHRPIGYISIWASAWRKPVFGSSD